MQHGSINSAMNHLEPTILPFYRSDDTKRSETMSAVLDWSFPALEVLKSGAEWFAKKVVELLHCDNLYLDTL